MLTQISEYKLFFQVLNFQIWFEENKHNSSWEPWYENKEKFIEYLTKTSINEYPVIFIQVDFDDEILKKDSDENTVKKYLVEKIFKKEFDANSDRLFFDENGFPHILEEIQGVQNELGRIEFTGRFFFCIFLCKNYFIF